MHCPDRATLIAYTCTYYVGGIKDVWKSAWIQGIVEEAKAEVHDSSIKVPGI